ncbi:MAG: YjbQ family protein [Acidimicrobiales bacterium]
MDSDEIELTTGRELVTDVTSNVRRFCEGRGSGLLHLFVPHATAGLGVIETGSGTESDLGDAISRLVPRLARYSHAHGSKGHGGDHVLPAFVSPSLVLAVREGEVVLGTWQRVVVVDPNLDNPRRRLLFHFLVGQD